MKKSRCVLIASALLTVLLAACEFTDEYETQEYSEPVGDTVSAEIRVDMPFEEATIGMIEDPATLFDATLETVGKVTYNVSGTTNKGIDLVEKLGNTSYTGDKDLVWTILLNPEVPINFVMNMNDGDLEADLSGLNLTGLEFSMYTGEATVTLPNNAIVELSPVTTPDASETATPEEAASPEATPESTGTEVLDEELAEAVEAEDVDAVVSQVVENILEVALIEVSVGELILEIPENALVDFDNVSVDSGSIVFEVSEGVSFDTDVEVSSGQLTFDIPQETGVQVNILSVDTEGSVVVPPDYIKVTNGQDDLAGAWESPNFEEAVVKIIITGEVGEGSLIIE
jgi:hypothetical protein